MRSGWAVAEDAHTVHVSSEYAQSLLLWKHHQRFVHIQASVGIDCKRPQQPEDHPSTADWPAQCTHHAPKTHNSSEIDHYGVKLVSNQVCIKGLSPLVPRQWPPGKNDMLVSVSRRFAPELWLSQAEANRTSHSELLRLCCHCPACQPPLRRIVIVIIWLHIRKQYRLSCF